MKDILELAFDFPYPRVFDVLPVYKKTNLPIRVSYACGSFYYGEQSDYVYRLLNKALSHTLRPLIIRSNQKILDIPKLTLLRAGDLYYRPGSHINLSPLKVKEEEYNTLISVEFELVGALFFIHVG